MNKELKNTFIKDYVEILRSKLINKNDKIALFELGKSLIVVNRHFNDSVKDLILKGKNKNANK
jgi:hypothetical protein